MPQDPRPGVGARRRSTVGGANVRNMSWVAVEAAGIGTFDWDLLSGALDWDDRMRALFGYGDGDVTFDGSIESFNRRVEPDDLLVVEEALRHAQESDGDYEVEYRVRLPGGGSRWVAARGRVLRDDRGTAVRIVGAAYDTTTVQESEARVARVLEAIPTAFFALDRQWRFTYVNAEAERVLDSSRERLLGGVLWDLFPDALQSDFEEQYRGAMATGQSAVFEAFYPAPLNRWYEVRAWPGPDGLSVYFLDITARRAEQTRTAELAARAALTAAVTSALAESLEVEAAVGRLAQLVVPALADWCVVTMVVDDPDHGLRGNAMRDIASWHAEEDARPLVERYAATRLSSLEDDAYLTKALRTNRVLTVREGATRAVQQVLRPGEAHELIGRLGPESGSVFPLRARGRTLGALSLFSGPRRAPMTDEELAAAEEVAGRAALALDNARLYRQQRNIAEGLQRTLLTEPVQPDHLQIAVRYHPAAEAAQVGGDWYDAFVQPDGATVLVIGDVTGHDIAAAATMAQTRSLLRGIAVTTGAPPGLLLQQVDQALRTLQSTALATAVVVRLEQDDEEALRGVTRVRWSNAGHPVPMLINPDGLITPLSTVRHDPLLGVLPDTVRTESEVTLDRGATLLLYTDGLVERRDRFVQDGIVELAETLSRLVDLELDEMLDQVLTRMLPARPEDDIALLAVRLHDQSEPRPAEAGPQRLPPNVPDSPEVYPQP